MSAEQRKIALGRLRRLTSKEAIISILGGEPTLRPELLLEAVADAAHEGFIVNLVTNGARLTADLIAELGRLGLRHLAISVDCDRDQRRGDLEKALGLLRIARSQKILSVINTVITSETDVESLGRVARTVIEAGFFFSPLACSPQVPGGSFSAASEGMTPSNRQLREMVPYLVLTKAATGHVTSSFGYLWTLFHCGGFKGSSIRLWHCSPRFRRDAWSMGRSFLTLDSDGAIGPCQEFPRLSSILDFPAGELSLKSLDGQFNRTTHVCPGCLHNCYIMAEKIRGVAALAEIPTGYQMAKVWDSC